MKAHLINTHLLVPRSRSSAKVKVKYKGYISPKMAVSGAFVFNKHILFTSKISTHCHSIPCLTTLKWETSENVVAQREIAYSEQFLHLHFPLRFLLYWRIKLPLELLSADAFNLGESKYC